MAGANVNPPSTKYFDRFPCRFAHVEIGSSTMTFRIHTQTEEKAMIREATNVNRPAIGPEQDLTNHSNSGSNSGPNSGRINAFRLAAAILVCFAVCSHAETASSLSLIH